MLSIYHACVNYLCIFLQQIILQIIRFNFNLYDSEWKYKVRLTYCEGVIPPIALTEESFEVVRSSTNDH